MFFATFPRDGNKKMQLPLHANSTSSDERASIWTHS